MNRNAVKVVDDDRRMSTNKSDAVAAAETKKRHSTTTSNKPLLPFASDSLVGCASAAFVKTALAPVERAKLLLATQNSNPKVVCGEVTRAAGTFDSIRLVQAEQGMLALWRGNLVNCLRYAPQQGLALAFNDVVIDMLPNYDSKTQFWQSMGSKLFCGGLAGAIANTVCYPFDFARARLAFDVDKGKAQFKGITDCIVTTVKQHGFGGVYVGWRLSVADAFMFRAAQLCLFKQMQDLSPYKHDKGSRGIVAAFAAATFAQTIAQTVSSKAAAVMLRKQLIRASLTHQLTQGIGGSLIIVAYDRVKTIFGI